MKTNEFQPVSFDDVIFENRHKGYGAYDIRKHYDVHLKTALTIAIISMLLLILFPKVMQHFTPQLKITEVVIPEYDWPVIKPEQVILPKTDKPVQETQTAAAPAPTKRYLVPAVVDRIIIHEDIPTNREILKSDDLIGSQNIDGEKNPNNILGDNTGGNGNANNGLITEPETPMIYVEDMPTFVGGDAAMQKFIYDHINYPENGVTYGLQGTVWVQFTVGKNGKVTDPKILQSVKGGFDEEALRVIKMMPAWKPGKQNGREVPVYIKLPIKFTLKN